MQWLFFLLGGMIATGLLGFLVYRKVKRKVHGFTQEFLGTTDIRKVIEDAELEAEETPRSLSKCDRLVLPKILKDFPDFDAHLAETNIHTDVKSHLSVKKDVTIYDIGISNYLPSTIQKTIVYQAAVSFREDGRKIQKRYDVYYTFILPQENSSIAANCPNCGGALSYGETTCPFCDSRVVNVLGNTWEVTQILES